MTIATSNNRVEYTGNGVTQAFSFPNKFFANSDLVVLLVTIADDTSATQVLDTDYTVSGAGDAAGGTVTFTTAPPSTKKVVIYRDPAMTQAIDMVNGDSFDVDTSVEKMADQRTLVEQRNRELVLRALRLAESDYGFASSDMELPTTLNRASKYLAFDANGKPVASTGTGADSGLRTDLASTADVSLGDALIGGKHTLTNAVAFTLHQYHENRAVNVKTDFGAVGDGVTDDTTAIQNAIDAVGAAGGGKIRFPAGVYAISSGLVVEKNGVSLVGAGQGISNYAGGSSAAVRATAATTIKWIGSAGSGTMVKFTSDSADGGTETAKGGGGIDGIFIDGQENALVGLEIQTWFYGEFRNILVGWVRTYGYKFWTLTNGLTTGTSNTSHNNFSNLSYCETNTNYDPTGMIIGSGKTGTNTCLNTFRDTFISMDGDGTGLELENCDFNVFIHTLVGPRGGGVGVNADVILHADDTGVLLSGHTACHENIFIGLEATGTFTAKATVAGSTSSYNNQVFGYMVANGTASPVIESGADLQFWETEGMQFRDRLRIVKNDDTSGAGPHIFLERTSAAAADGDNLSQIQFKGTNDALQSVEYARIAANIADASDSTEDGKWSLLTMQDGTLTTEIFAGKGTGFGSSPSGGSKGAGTINVQNGVYVNGIPIFSGSGTPEGAKAAVVGSLYLRTDGGASTTLYVKESGTGNTGWVAK
jgi:hypothetical protein